MKQKLITIFLLSVITLSLTGCSSNLKQWANSKLPSVLEQRGEDNKGVARKYHEMGAISSEDLKRIENQIDTQVAKLTETDGEGNVTNKSLDLVANAVSWYKLATGGGEGTHPEEISIIDGEETKNYIWDSAEGNYVPEDGIFLGSVAIEPGSWIFNGNNKPYISNFILPNYLHAYKYGKSGDINNQAITYTRDPVKEVKPIEFIPEDLKQEINEKMYAEIYVLKGDMNTTSNSLDGILESISVALDNPDTSAANQVLENYFMPLKDDSGNPITLVDKPANKNEETPYDMVVTSKDNPDNILRLGYDLPISQEDFTDCIRLRLVEFSEDNLSALNSLKSTGGKFKFIADPKTTWRAYLIEYPVSIITGMEDTGNDEVSIDIEKSALGVNLVTKELINYDVTRNENGTLINYDADYSSGVAVKSDSMYLTIDSADNESSVSISSFIIQGYNDTEVETLNGTKHTRAAGRIILRDYLEFTYAPECVDGENLVAFGRKIRFDMENGTGAKGYWTNGDKINNIYSPTGDVLQKNLKYKKGDKIAWFVNENGVKLNNSNYLTITDFCSANLLTDENYSSNKVVSILEKGLDNYTKKSTLEDGSLPKQSDLLHVQVTSKIHPTFMFPSEEIGSIDYKDKEYNNQRFYGVTTTKGLFDSGLSGDWINVNSSTESLTWWNSYLKDNEFNYDVSTSRVSDYLIGNYQYELSKEGMIILDLDIVNKLQQQFDENSNQRTTTNIRTIFMILGWALILYSFLLAISWVLDTNADLGIKLMEKLTLGHWVAVRYAEDIPAQNVNECTYLTASTMIIRCLLMIAMGSLLILINVFDLVLIIIKTFGGIAESIEKIITGMR